jgi:hypothetical protein
MRPALAPASTTKSDITRIWPGIAPCRLKPFVPPLTVRLTGHVRKFPKVPKPSGEGLSGGEPEFVSNRHTRKGMRKMFWLCAALSAAGILESVICSCLAAELAGYRLRQLLRSGKLPFPSHGRMVRHLLVHGPQQPTRTQNCTDDTCAGFPMNNSDRRGAWQVPVQHYKLTTL